jgi:predicted PurR-regulated permease PerM
MARTSRDLILWFFLALFIISLLLLGKLFWPFLSVIVLSSIIASLSHPVYRKIEANLKPTYASLLTCLLILLVIFIPTVLIFTVLLGEVQTLVHFFKSTDLQVQIINFLETNRIIERLNVFSERFHVTMNYGDLVQPLSDFGTFVGFNLINQVNAIAGHILNLIIGFCLILIATYYFLIDGKRLINFIIELSPLPNQEDETLLKQFKEMSGAVLIGNGISGVIQGIIGGIICYYCGFHSPMLWGLITGFFSFLPIFGIGVIIFPTMIFMMIKGRLIAAVCLFVIYIIVTAGIEYIVRPFLVGKRVNMHPLLVFFSIIGGIYMAGLLGVIYGPLIMIFFLTLADIYHSNYRKHVDPDNDPAYEDTNQTEMKNLGEL